MPSSVQTHLSPMSPKCYCPLLFGERHWGAPQRQFTALQVEVNTRGSSTNGHFYWGKRWFMKIDEKSITRSVEECENKDTPHTSQNFDDYSEWRATKSQPCAPDSRNQSISEQAQVRYKMKNYNKKWFKSKFCIASDHFWSQKSGHHQPELWVFPRENEWFRIFTRSRSTMCS